VASVTNYGDPDQVKANDQILDLAEKQLRKDIREVAGTPQGRRLLWWILEQSNLYSPSFTGNSHTFFNEGRRDIGLRILSKITEAEPELYPRLMMENLDG
jgi:hypothetical protein